MINSLQILVHGEKHNMMRLKSKLLSLNADKATKVKIYSPANTEELRIPFKADLIAKVVGKLAQISPPKTDNPDDAQLLNGVLVQKDFKLSLMAAEDLREYAGLTTTTITCKRRITLRGAGIGLVRWGLEGVFGSIEEIGRKKKTEGESASTENGHDDSNGDGDGDVIPEETVKQEVHPVAYLVMGCVIVRHDPSGLVELEWEGNMMNDGMADAVLSVLLQMESSPAAVRRKLLVPYLCLRTHPMSKSLRAPTSTTSLLPAGTLMRTSRPKSASRACACFSKHSLALKFAPSRGPSSGSKPPKARMKMGTSRQKRRSRAWMKRSKSLQTWRRPS